MKRIQQTKANVLLLAALLGFVRPALPAQSSSTFDTGFDGWSPVIFGFSWQSTGGNPGGFLQFSECCNPPFSSLVAPGSYLGNWSSLEGLERFVTIFNCSAAQPIPVPPVCR